MNPTKKNGKSSKVGLSHQLLIIHIVLSSILHFTITWQNYFYNTTKRNQSFFVCHLCSCFETFTYSVVPAE